jgi:hypothetical protein
VPFGIGAIVDFPNQTLMAAGLDAWPQEPQCQIHDDRLAKRLGIKYFRSPPPGPRDGQKGEYLPFVRFPLWYLCPRQQCKALIKVKWNEGSRPKCASQLGTRFKEKEDEKYKTCSELTKNKRRSMNPVRFVVACEHGHIDDFPWVEWVHTPMGRPLDEVSVCSDPKLRLAHMGSAGLGGLWVNCQGCDKKRSMLGSAGENSLKGYVCTGNRPWLGEQGREICNAEKPPMMLQRSATNLHFSKIASAILIPPFSNPIRKLIDDQRNWRTLSSGVNEDGLPDDQRLRFFAEDRQVPFDRLKEAVIQKLTGEGTSDSETEEEFRYSEYRALLEATTSSSDDFFAVKQDVNLYSNIVSKYIDKIVLVEKLAETRALTGFSRIKPPPYREFDHSDQMQLSNARKNWLPAIRVYGEGIFLTLKKELVDQFLANGEIIKRSRLIVSKHKEDCKKLNREPSLFSDKFFLLHTLAHILIRRLTFECGYGSSALRERIYCSDGNNPMTGILIYTAAGDCEGTMGGLVRQGRPGIFEPTLLGAIEDASTCSSDPLCIESGGQGIGSVNLAACHACTLLPETSCEEGNRFLDRATLVGTHEDPSMGYFSDMVAAVLSG